MTAPTPTGPPMTVAAARQLREIDSTFGDGIFIGGSGVKPGQVLGFVEGGVRKGVLCIRRTPDGPDEWVKQVIPGGVYPHTVHGD